MQKSKFLQCVASYVSKRYKDELEQAVVVFPNRRSGLFFMKYLSEQADYPCICPRIITIAELISSLSGVILPDKHTLLFYLYSVFSREVSGTESFDEFYYWGEMLLSDFNDLDKYLVDAQQLFGNIESLKQIDVDFDFMTEQQLEFLSSFWNVIKTSRDSANKEYFMNIWKHLFPVYQKFRAELQKRRYAYEGMLYREIAERIKSSPFDLAGNKYFIVGFNALNPCEKKLFDFLKSSVNASFFWDYDNYYMQKDWHEAAFFMKENLVRYPMPSDFFCEYDRFIDLKSVEVVAIPGKTGQSVFVNHWLYDHRKEVSSQFDNTAVVLCDESLLTSVCSSLPDFLDDVNITMGYPVKGTLVYSLLKEVINVDRNSRPGTDGGAIFYYRQVLALINHPLLRPIIGADAETLAKEIQDKNKVYLSLSDFHFSESLQMLFQLPVELPQCQEYIQWLLKLVFDRLPEGSFVDKESVYQVYLAFNRFNGTLAVDPTLNMQLSKRMYYLILLRQLEGLSIAFEGEPLKGLQIMGFLETRNLDFDHVLLLSANDDKLPGNAYNHSFIPYSLRKGFGLPSTEQRQSMYSYYFYRLIQRAKRVTLLYDSRVEGMNRGEATRYVNQIKYEAAHLKIEEKKAVFDHEIAIGGPISIEKKQSVMNAIFDKLPHWTITPSTINIYLECKLRFYFRYVEGLFETEELIEEIDNLVFGRVAHVALEEIYKPLKGVELQKEQIDDIIANEKLIRQSLATALEKEYFKGGKVEMKGKNLLVYNIVYSYIRKILEFDKSLAPIQIIALEQLVVSTLEIEARGRKYNCMIGGTIDRIDKVAGNVRIVDYKTGKSSNEVKSIPSLFFDKNRNKAAFQTMMYAYCLFAQGGVHDEIIPSVYGARSIFADDFSSSFSISGEELMFQKYSGEFIENLRWVLSEWFNTEVPFNQTDDKNKCKTCPYNIICQTTN